MKFKRLRFFLIFFISLLILPPPISKAAPEDQQTWKGIITLEHFFHRFVFKDESKKQKTKIKRELLEINGVIILFVCGSTDLKVYDVSGSINARGDSYFLEQEKSRVCPKGDEWKKHNPLYRMKHWDELFEKRKPGNSRLLTEIYTGNLYGSHNCGPFGEKGVAEPSVSFNIIGSKYKIFAGAALIVDEKTESEEIIKYVCENKTIRNRFYSTTIDCGMKPSVTAREDEEGNSTIISQNNPLLLSIGGVGSGNVGRVLKGKSIISERAKDETLTQIMYWILTQENYNFKKECDEMALKTLKGCIHHMFENGFSEMNLKKASALARKATSLCRASSTAMCLSGVLSNDLNDKLRCIEENCFKSLDEVEKVETEQLTVLGEYTIKINLLKCFQRYFELLDFCKEKSNASCED